MKAILGGLAILVGFVAVGVVVWRALPRGSSGVAPESPARLSSSAPHHPNVQSHANTAPSTSSDAPSSNASDNVGSKSIGVEKTPRTVAPGARGVLQGVVKSKAGGQPVEGANVRLEKRTNRSRLRTEERLLLETTTDAQGEFLVRTLPDGFYTILATTDDLVGVESANLDDGNAYSDIVIVMERAGAIAGQVKNEDGQPVSNAEVRAYPPSSKNRPSEKAFKRLCVSDISTKTDGTGEFTLSPLPEGTWELAATADGYVRAESNPARLGSQNVELILKRGAKMACSVSLADTGKAMPNVRIRVSDANPSDAVSDESGHAEFLGLAEGKHTVYVEDPNLVLVSPDLSVTIRAGVPPEEVKLSVTTGGVVTGRVYDADTRNPVAGVKLRAELTGEGYHVREVTSGVDGVYRIEGLMAGKFELSRGESGDYIRNEDGDEKAVLVELGKTVENMDFALKRGIAVRGRVVDGSGRPVPRAEVHVGPQDVLPLRHGRAACFTDEDGVFEQGGLQPFTNVAVCVKKRDLAQESQGEMTLRDQDVDGVEIVMCKGASVSGVVVTSAGKPVGEVAVFASPESRSSASRSSYTDTDEDGQFTIGELSPGTYEMRVHHGQRQPIELAKGQDITDLTLMAETDARESPGAAGDRDDLQISGRVTNRKGEPVALADVAADSTSSDDFSYGSSLTDRDGRYTISGLTAGLHKVTASSSEYTDAAIVGVEAGTTGVNLTLDALASVDGKVVDAATSAPLASFQIAERHAQEDGDSLPFSARLSMETSFVSFTNADGKFHMRVQAHNPTLEVRAAGYSPAKQEVKGVRAGETTAGVIFRLEAGAVIEGTVRNAQGDPLLGAQVQRVDDDMPYLRDRGQALATTGAQGRFRIDSLSGDSVTLTVTHVDYVSAAQTITPQLGKTTTATFTLVKGGTVIGTVTKNGKPFSGAQISIWSHARETEPWYASTDANGAYTIIGVPPGEVDVTAKLTEITVGRVTKTKSADIVGDTIIRVDFDLTPGEGSLEGRITDAGQPVKEASVTLLDTNLMEMSDINAETDETGSYRLAGLPVGKILLEIDAQTAGGADSTSSTSENRIVAAQTRAGSTTRLDVDLAAGGRVTGTIAGINAGDHARVGALRGEVTVNRESLLAVLRKIDGVAGGATVGPDGAYILRGLDAGRYTIVAGVERSKPGRDSAQAPAPDSFASSVVTVPANGEIRCDLKLP